jgi:RecQ-mediated genome instability protein 1
MDELEAIERIERGETRRGREVNRAIPAAATDSNSSTNPTANPIPEIGHGPHKLLLQDAKGTKVWAIELKKVDGVRLGICLGTKLLLRDVRVARGMVLLEPGGVQVLGGKIEELDKEWREGRKGRLVRELKGEAGGGGGGGGGGGS